MSIAIIIGTHGSASEHLLKSVEMILGKQENISWINFFSGENTDILVKKFTEKLDNLNTKLGILFMVDTWGGSPFNAASRIVIEKENSDIITGVNIPILIEVLMKREENVSLNELIKIAIDTGSICVRSLKFSKFYSKKIESSSISYSTTLKSIDSLNNHMMIALVRIDDRLIHGQVVTRWTKETNINRIIVINDEIASDNIRKTLLTQVAPPGITAHVIDVNKAIRVYNNPKYAKDRVMFLFTNPTDVVRIVEGGIKIISVNIGGMAFKHGKKQVTSAVSLDKKDIEAFEKLNNKGVKLEIRKVPSDSPVNIMDLIKKLTL